MWSTGSDGGVASDPEAGRTTFAPRVRPGGMVEAWIQLRCPSCDRRWESSPTDLPSPQAAFECDGCGASRPTAEFMRDQRDLEILKQFAA